MKILIINTSGSNGGAAIAATRLRSALYSMGQQATMLVAGNLSYKASKMRERLGVFVRQGCSLAHLWDIDPATAGVDITKTRDFKEADIIHLHWVNQGFLSLKILRRIFASGKPVVWTMHDAWPFTGICHSPLDCRHFRHHCGNCMLLRRQSHSDWSQRVWKKKAQLYGTAHRIAFVACSQWLADMARSSSLLADHTVLDIPNPIDTQLFAPADRQEARRQLGLPPDKQYIFFSAYNVNAPIKGLRYLREACAQLVMADPAMQDRIAIVCAGRGAGQLQEDMPVKVYPMGYITDPRRMAVIYNAVDLFCIPSLQENLPNTIMEAKACGVPTVGFRVGGIPQMIDHQSDGYLAEPQDASDLARGIRWVLREADAAQLSRLNRAAAEEQYSEPRVAERYMQLYHKMINES